MELKDILFCEASGSYTNFCIAGQPDICSAKAIHEYEEILTDSGFVRIHKSYLVNISHVKEYMRERRRIGDPVKQNGDRSKQAKEGSVFK